MIDRQTLGSGGVIAGRSSTDISITSLTGMKMHHLAKICVLFAIVVGVLASIAATDSANHRAPDLTGKSVIVDREGWYIGVSENVRFVTIGKDSFIVIPSPESQAEYDQWIPLEKVSGIKVFDELTDAEAYARQTSPFAKTEDAGAPDEPIKTGDAPENR